MKRTFNYTGRKKIERSDVSITLLNCGETWKFDAHLKLSEYGFQSNAEIWLEAHRQNLWMQWYWGTISTMSPPAERALSEFDVPDGVRFRVRVVHPKGTVHHRLLGEADNIPFIKAGEATEKRRHLLEPLPADLGQLLWRIDFDTEQPRLLINKNLAPSWKEAARRPEFIALVYPEVMRSILREILIENNWTEDNDDEGWKEDWISFAKALTSAGKIPDGKNDRGEWIAEAVSAFCQQMKLMNMWEDAQLGGSVN